MRPTILKPTRAAAFFAIAASVLPSSIHAYSQLSDAGLAKIPFPSEAEFSIKSGGLLAPILIPRVPGTEGSLRAMDHLTSVLKSIGGWDIQISNSSSVTPLSKGKKIEFRNIVATLDPPGANPAEVNRLTLVAHYDSKIEPAGFIGATDSAAPCAMILHVAKVLTGAIRKKWAEMEKKEKEEGWFNIDDPVGLQILFLDGEEAFETWTEEDSLYGARALAEQWERETYATTASQRGRNKLANISLFVLLDLLGYYDPRIPSYFKTTHWAYQHMANLEHRLRTMKRFESDKSHPKHWFVDRDKSSAQIYVGMGGIEDDHIPFLRRGVEVLHVIPNPFPEYWHTIRDDGEHLHMESTRDWAGLVAAFVAEWMELEDFLDELPKNAPRSVKTEL